MNAVDLDDLAAHLAVTIAPALVTAVQDDDAPEVHRLLTRLDRQELLALAVVLANNLADDDEADQPAGPALKQCRRCKQVKPAADFYPEKRHRDGLKSYCKPCDLTIVAESKKRKACA